MNHLDLSNVFSIAIIIIITIITSITYLRFKKKLKPLAKHNVSLNKILYDLTPKAEYEQYLEKVDLLDEVTPYLVKEEFNWNQNNFFNLNQEILLDYFQCINQQENFTNEFCKQKVRQKKNAYINNQKQIKTHEFLTDVDFNKTIISKYQAKKGIKTITLLTLVDYIHYITNQKQKVIYGEKHQKISAIYQTTFQLQPDNSWQVIQLEKYNLKKQ